MQSLICALVITAGAGEFAPAELVAGTPYVLPGHGETLTAIAFSPDSKKLASAARDKNLKIWSLETGKATLTVKVGLEQLSAIAWTTDGKRLAVGDVSLSVQILEAETGKVLEQIAHPNAVSELAFTPDGAAIAVGGVADVGAVYEVPGGKKRFEFAGRTVRFSADGKTLVVASNAGTFTLLDAKTGKAKSSVKTYPELPLICPAADLQTIATWSPSGTDVRVWTAAGKLSTTIVAPTLELGPRKPTVTGCAMSKDGKRVVVGGADGIIRFYAVGTPAATRRWPSDRNLSVTMSPDESWIATIDAGVIKLWKL